MLMVCTPLLLPLPLSLLYIVFDVFASVNFNKFQKSAKIKSLLT
uniref:Uncharacterized protein n=1 Tax=Myoviridae sp. ctv1i11 TaxID=2826709 RepID=A0A8S5MVV7_9CAUD|nr:MAG TPA: hypothetical protein [Myoviridae sp. ctv1i11]